eukprot:13664454-Ditylum_brightwellii.AAC.1
MHYAVAVLMERGGGAYIDCILTPDTALKAKQFTFCLTLFQLTPVDKDLLHNAADDANQLMHFDSVENPLNSTMFQLLHPNNILELGSQASRQAQGSAKKKPVKSALSSKKKYSNNVIQQPSAESSSVTPKERLKTALRRFVAAQRKTSALLNSIPDYNTRAIVAGLFDANNWTPLSHSKKTFFATPVENFCDAMGIPGVADVSATDDASVTSEIMEASDRGEE